MPKNKFQDVIFTIIMATIMVYGMVVYNVALNTGEVSGFTFFAALHELPVMVPIAFVLEFFGFFSYEADGSSTVYYVCDLNLHLLYYVSCHEPDRHDFI